MFGRRGARLDDKVTAIAIATAILLLALMEMRHSEHPRHELE